MIIKKYEKTRSFTTQELQNELGEYFENQATIKMFPSLAATKADLTKLIKQAPLSYLTESQLSTLNNSDVGIVFNDKNPYRYVIEMAKKYGKNINSIFDGIASNKTFPCPLVIKPKTGPLYLMAGNTRLCAFAALNMTLPVKIIVHP